VGSGGEPRSDLDRPAGPRLSILPDWATPLNSGAAWPMQRELAAEDAETLTALAGYG
jgi:hypothetical protein